MDLYIFIFFFSIYLNIHILEKSVFVFKIIKKKNILKLEEREHLTFL